MPLKNQNATRRETAKKNFHEEKKELEHEFATNQELIKKLENDKYEFKGESITKGKHVIEFFNRDTKLEKKITFDFEENYVKLKDLWLS
jgi:hypothetical protein